MEDGALFLWIQSVTVDQLPPGPFRLNYCTTVEDPGRWLAVVQGEARLPMGGARGKTGVLQREIQTLHELIESPLW